MIEGTTSATAVTPSTGDAGASAPTGIPGSPLMPEPSGLDIIGGDIGAELAKILIDMSRKQRDLAKSIRAAEEKAQVAAENAQLSALREKADNAFMAGMVSGAMTFTAGAIEFGGGIAMAKAPTQARADLASKLSSGASKTTEAQGRLLGAAWQKAADLDGTYATEEEQRAGHHKRAAEDARDDMKDAEDLIDKATSFLKEYQTARQDASKAALFRA